MKTFLKSAFATAAATLLFGAVSANAACTLFEHANFQGQSGVLGENHLLRFNAAGTADPVLMNRKVETFRDPSWFKKLSAVQTSDNCEAIVWNLGSGHRQFRTTVLLPPEFNDATQGVFCQCK